MLTNLYFSGWHNKYYIKDYQEQRKKQGNQGKITGKKKKTSDWAEIGKHFNGQYFMFTLPLTVYSFKE